MILHLIFSSPNQSSAFQDCLNSMNSEDHILLLEDGVYSTMIPTTKMQLSKLCWSALEADLLARGLNIGANNSINYHEMVNLTLKYDKTISWR